MQCMDIIESADSMESMSTMESIMEPMEIHGLNGYHGIHGYMESMQWYRESMDIVESRKSNITCWNKHYLLKLSHGKKCREMGPCQIWRTGNWFRRPLCHKMDPYQKLRIEIWFRQLFCHQRGPSQTSQAENWPRDFLCPEYGSTSNITVWNLVQAPFSSPNGRILILSKPTDWSLVHD